METDTHLTDILLHPKTDGPIMLAGSDVHRQNQQKLKKSIKTLIPPELPVKEEIGKNYIGLMRPRGPALQHPAAPLLHYYSTQGCPVDCGEPWSLQHIMQAVKRGNHISAKTEEAITYLEEESIERVQGGFVSIKKLGEILKNRPKNFKLSPLAMIHHNSRKFRCLLDLSFQLRMKRMLLSSVNGATVLLAPQKAMAQLGSCIKRMIQFMAQAYDLKKPFAFAKIDVKDGYWRMFVSKDNAWHFCYMITPREGVTIEDIQIVIPNSLQMGWRESPPYFCAATETARDVIEQLSTTTTLQQHYLEDKMLAQIEELPPSTPAQPTTFVEVYVDDFCCGTNNLSAEHLRHLSRAILHGVHLVFPPPHISGHNGHDPVSIKKIDEGEGMWGFEKELLGWVFNGKDYTIHLPQAKVTKAIKLLKEVLIDSTITLNNLQKVAGKLQHASYGIPGGKGLFSPIWKAFKSADKDRVDLTPPVSQALRDWITIIRQIGSRPTSVLELQARPPQYVGYVDASGFGAGGVWFGGEADLQPTVWRIDWPEEIQEQLVSKDNPNGIITNSDLEMAGHLLQWLVLEEIAPRSLQYQCAGIFTDNTPTVQWAYKLSSTSSIIAGFLLRALAIRMHVHRTAPLLTTHIAGEHNTMADTASRSARLPVFKSSNKPFIITFNSLFPLPQKASWKEFTLPNARTSLVISCLLGKQLELASWMKIPGQDKNIGLTGQPTLPNVESTPSSQIIQGSPQTSSSQHSLQGSGQATTAEDVKSKFSPLLKHLQPSARPSNWLENTPRSTKHRKLTQLQWDGSWKASVDKTPQQSHK